VRDIGSALDDHENVGSSARLPRMTRLELFYDIESVYSYFAFCALERYRAVWPIELVLRPALVGGVFKAVGNVPPITLNQRAPYLLRDVGRNGGYFGVPVAIPENFPTTGLVPMRLLTIVARERPDRLFEVTRALYARHWGEGKEVDAPDTQRAILDACGVDPALVERIGEQANKDALKAATDEAVARGAFGFPAIFIAQDGRDEMYFGSDRFPVIAHEMGWPWRGPNP
jgi:glutathione S-transferase kappa 1